MKNTVLELGKTYVTENIIFTVEDTTENAATTSKYVRFQGGNFWRCGNPLNVELEDIIREATEDERLIADKVYINGDILASKEDAPKETEEPREELKQPENKHIPSNTDPSNDIWEARRWEIGENVLSSLIREADTKDLNRVAELGAIAAKVTNDFVNGLKDGERY